MKKAFLLIVTSFLLLLGLTIITYDMPLEQKSFVNFQTKYKDYTLSPEDWNVQKMGVLYPHVDVSPSNLMYTWNNIQEKIDIKLKNRRPLDYTSKIISEIRKWGNELPIDTPNNQSSWSTLLTHYGELINEEITLVNNQEDVNSKQTRFKEIKRHLDGHNQELQYIIYSLDKANNTKHVLASSVKGLFNSLNDKIPVIRTSQPKELSYSLFPIINEKEYGIYRATIDTANTTNLPEKISGNIILKMNEELIDPERFPINDPNILLTVELPENQSVEQRDWREEIHEKDVNPYRYYFDIPLSEYEKGREYFLALTYDFDTPVIIQLEQQLLFTVKDKKGRKKKTVKTKDILVNELLLPVTEKTTVRRETKLSKDDPDRKYGGIKFVILSEKPLADKIKSAYLELTPLYAPPITFEKIDNLEEEKPEVAYEKIKNNFYNIKFSNTSIDQENYILGSLGLGWRIAPLGNYAATAEFAPAAIVFRLFILSTIVFLLDLYYLFLKFLSKGERNWIDWLLSKRLWIRIFIFILKIIGAPFVLLSNLFFKVCRRYKSSLFVLVAMFILLDILYLQNISNTTKFFFLLIWIYITNAFPVNAKMSIVSALSLLTLSGLSLFVNNEVVAEKAAVWTYLLLTVGIGQLLYQLKFHNKNILDVYEFSNNIIKESKLIGVIYIVYRHLRKNYVPLFILLIKLLLRGVYFFIIKRIINPNPKTKFDIFLNGARLMIFVSIVASVAFGSFIAIDTISKKIIAENRRKIRLSQNPQIKTVQPYLVYRSTKVVIKGTNLGWKQEEANKLMSQYGEVITAPWTESKITFTVPLSWKSGTVDLWIEKPVVWEGQNIITKSNIVTIKVISAGSSFTEDDDAFFEQLKNLDKDVLELNGYEKTKL